MGYGSKCQVVATDLQQVIIDYMIGACRQMEI